VGAPATRRGFLKLRIPQGRSLLGAILLLGLLHGLLYVFLVPPWQHNDEPTHFEYAWLIANHPGLPKPGDYDQSMRREVALSMIDHNFFRGMDFLPDLEAKNEPIWIGYSQLNDPPLYYLIVSLPLRLLHSLDITVQLYTARFVSLVFFLMSIMAAWGIMGEILPAEHPLLSLVPLSLVLLSGYVDLMTSVNNDAGAVMLFSLFLWGSVQIIRRGFSYKRLLWVGGTAVLCMLTKNTVYLALGLFCLVLMLTLFRGRWRWLPWTGLSATLIVLLILVFSWDGTLSWFYSANNPEAKPTRILSPEAPMGNYAIQLDIPPIQPSPAIFQILPLTEAYALQGKTLTLGAWIWANKPLTATPFFLDDGRTWHYQTVKLTTSPKFFMLSATLAKDANRVRVILTSIDKKNAEAFTIYYDGLVLVEGARPPDSVPKFESPDAKQGSWAGEAFTNLLRNASGEVAGPNERAWIAGFRQKFFPALPSPSLALSAILDWRWAGWFYPTALQDLLRTFWAKFGWSHVFLNVPFIRKPYLLLTILTLLGLGGAGLVLWRKRAILPWNILLFLGFAITGIWGQALLRGVLSLANNIVFFPGARYVYPSIIPAMLVLNAGWWQIGRSIEKWTRIPSSIKYMVFCFLFLCLDIAAIYTISQFYYN
jgi:hypothetical protein